jgi:hypothetical protein
MTETPCTCEDETLDSCPKHIVPVDRFSKNEWKQIGAVPAQVARSITQRVTRFLKDESGREFQEYVKRARVTHAMIEDYHARVAKDPDARKKAAETFLKLSESLMPKRKK